jgi:actin-related protein 10
MSGGSGMEHVFGGSEKAAVVIDLGTSFTKCGFAGEAQPRHILPSKFKLLSGREISSVEILLGSTEHNEEEQKEALEVFFNSIYFQ